MSGSDTSVSASDIQTYVTGNQILLAATAVYYYEWLVTLDQEVTHVWQQKWSMRTVIFGISRYTTFADTMVKLLPTPTLTSCEQIARLDEAFSLLQFATLALFTGLRAYALNDKIWVLVLVTGLCSAPFFCNLALYTNTVMSFAVASPSNICDGLPGSSVFLPLQLASRSAVIVSDIIVLAITWKRTASIVNAALQARMKMTISRVLIRDGTFFFLALLALNVLQILSSAVPSFFPFSAGTAFLQPLTTIIMSRFMLNLRQVATTLDTTDTTSTSLGNNIANGRSTLRFDSGALAGSLGGSLDFEDQNGEDEDVEARGEVFVASTETQDRVAFVDVEESNQLTV